MPKKIGFHISKDFDPKLVGGWLEALAQAKRPFFVQLTDSPNTLEQAQHFAHQQPKSTILYRCDVDVQQNQLAEPNYDLEPEAAAAAHWTAHKAALPTHLDKEMVWVEAVSRPRPELKWADWLGEFTTHTAQMALADGYKFVGGGYGAGEPSDRAWERNGWVRFLELCQRNAGKLGMGLHEFSFKTNDIWYMRGDQIGRFEKLLRACDKNQLKRPLIFISQFGWTHNRLPRSTKQALADIQAVSSYYNEFPEIVGAAIWTLSPGWGGVARRAKNLVEPITDWLIEPEPEAAMSPSFRRIQKIPQIGPSARRAARSLNSLFIRDVTIPDDTPLTFGTTFTKTWRIQNNGTQPWTNDFSLAFIGGTASSSVKKVPLPPLKPGEQGNVSVELTVPNKTGTFYWDWKAQDANGNPFGTIMYGRIYAEEPAPDKVANAKFVDDITIPDDMQFQASKSFLKTWRLQNNGTKNWSNDFSVRFISGTAMTTTTTQPLASVVAATPIGAGKTADISITFAAPATPGTYESSWRLFDDAGQPFGQSFYVRIIVPSPAGPSLAPVQSQRDPAWVNKRLGFSGSTQTIGKWGCLLTCFSMTASAFGHATTPAKLNDAMVRKGGFVNLAATQWNALSQVYSDIIFDGKMASQPDIIKYIDRSLAAGNPVSVQVDFTRSTPYSENDQHWVLIVGKDGDDYRINDPWPLPAQESSFKATYARANQPLWKSIISAIFYHPAKKPKPTPEPTPQPQSELQDGMNINPDAPHSNPMNSQDLKGIDWVRFVFKLDARVNPSERGDIQKAFDQYDQILKVYQAQGVKTLMVINQETVWGLGPWTGNNNWSGYAAQLATTAGHIARRYRDYGDQIAYQIWNEGDKKDNPASVYLEPENYALILSKVSAAIRAESPMSPIIFNGMATGPSETVTYLQRCQQALGGSLPVDAVGIHPYTRWAIKPPFDWGSKFGTLAQAFEIYKKGFPNMRFWITEIGVAADNEIGPKWYGEIGDYMLNIYRYVQENATEMVPVVIWFAWSDWMRHAGIVTKDGNHKEHVYPAFRQVRDRAF